MQHRNNVNTTNNTEPIQITQGTQQLHPNSNQEHFDLHSQDSGGEDGKLSEDNGIELVELKMEVGHNKGFLNVL